MSLPARTVWACGGVGFWARACSAWPWLWQRCHPRRQPGWPVAPPSLQHVLDQAGSGSVDFNPLLASVSCPIERGPVKEGSDASRFSVSTTVTATSIAYLGSRAKPSSYPTNNRIAPYELKTWQLRAYLTQYKVESDGDLHLVLNDSTGRHMVAEIPYGSCVPASSRWTSQIATARYAITHHYTVTTSWHYVHRLVDVRGLALSTSCTARPVPRATASSCTRSPASPSGRPATLVLWSSH